MTTTAAVAPRPLMTVEQYRARERRSDVRHEYVDGRAYAMSGESRAHNRIAANVFTRLFAAARGGPCRASFESVRLVVNSSREYYPDVVVACGPEPEDPHFEDAPCLLVEVLSPSTRHTDQREKSLVYKGIASLQQYAIVDPDRRRIEVYAREADGRWTVGDVIGSGMLELPCPTGAAPLTLDQVYRGAEPPPRAGEAWGEPDDAE